jgi:hypothetical protein
MRERERESLLQPPRVVHLARRSGVRDQGSGLRIQNPQPRVSGFRVQGVGFLQPSRVVHLVRDLQVRDLGSGFGIQNSGWRV